MSISSRRRGGARSTRRSKNDGLPQGRTSPSLPECKLPEPRASIHSAFCTKGCWQQFHRARCVVCEKDFTRTAEHQLVCGRRRCRAELKRQPEIYRPFHFGLCAQRPLPAPTPHAVPSAPSETLEKWASKPCIVRGLRWARADGDDDDWELRGPGARMVARVRQEGSGWWVARPRAIPEPPIEGRDEAMRRAERMAMWALPDRKVARRSRLRESDGPTCTAALPAASRLAPRRPSAERPLRGRARGEQ